VVRRLLLLPLTLTQSTIVGVLGALAALIPSPEGIRLVVMRSGSLMVPIPNGAATGGEERTLGTMVIEAPQDSTLVALATLVGERESDKGNGHVQLRVYTDEARIGRSIATLDANTVATLTVVAPIKVSRGAHEVRIALLTGETPLVIGELGAAALIMPQNMADWSTANI
jgi:hypothetical protein